MHLLRKRYKRLLPAGMELSENRLRRVLQAKYSLICKEFTKKVTKGNPL